MDPDRDSDHDSGRQDRRRVRWHDHNAERRRQVLDAAVAVIEAQPPGTEPRVQRIAERAGIGRTVVYRHFTGKADLHRALQAHIVGMMRGAVEPSISFAGSVQEIIGRIVTAYVDWAAAHPHLYLVIERELGDGLPGELVSTLRAAATAFGDLVRAGAGRLGVPLDDAQSATVDLLVVGIIGQVRGTVGHWVRERGSGATAAELAALLSRSIWFQLDGFARTLGVTLDPTQPLTRVATPA
ncbi:TetR/AcrR family transcriptional regulator [Amycolatopsis arida]|uniref:TetR/AcrR family transcriptional regulator n=1 Tax=Amycolatopsis arida TaxID=587909 RepID=UPI00141700CC|nr:TetR/AcrR family transcriptional regulator [Amycolatopsis arida]